MGIYTEVDGVRSSWIKWMVLGPLGCINNAIFLRKVNGNITLDVFIICQMLLNHSQVFVFLNKLRELLNDRNENFIVILLVFGSVLYICRRFHFS